MTAPDRTPLAGRYTLERELGAGGMGTVYRARDSRLDREVAVKLLSGVLAHDADAVRRFEREARAASSLNHPNIITVFDAGTDGDRAFIVTELLHGLTLQERIGGHPLPAAVAVDVAVRIASALSVAHAAGIVHRDLKPANVFLTKDGGLKLLDFGVARLIQAGESAGANAPPTLTREGAMVGTPAYMAPEQLRGEAVDARTDLFAFGCVLHEMLTGRSPFARESVADTMAAILLDPPDAVPEGVVLPAQLDRVRLRCLEKEPSARFQTASDLRFALEVASTADGAIARAGPAEGGFPRVAGPQRRLGWAGLAAALAAVGALAWGLGRSASGPDDAGPIVEHAAVVVPAAARPIAPAVAADGEWVAYIGLGTEPGLFVQFLNGAPAVDIARGTGLPLQTRTIVGGIDIVPDGSGISLSGRPRPSGLFEVPGVWVVPAPLGGPPRLVSDRFAAVRWSPDGTRIAGITANPLRGDAVLVASADGRDERILVPASGGQHLHHVAWGHDGRHVYYSRTLEPNHALAEIHRVSVDGGAPELIVPSQGTAMYPTPTPDGRGLVYAGDRPGEGLNLWYRPFDGGADRRLTAGPGEFTEPYISRDGRHLVSLARRRRGGIARVDVTRREAARLESFTAATEAEGDPSVDRTTGRVFFTSLRGGRRQIWAVAADGRGAIPITAGTEIDRRPVASGDGRQVAFISTRGGRRALWVVPAEGGTPRSIVEADLVDYPSWSPDARRIVYAAAGDAEADLWIVDVAGGPPVPLESENGRVPAWSPVRDEIAFVALVDGAPHVRFVDSRGAPVRDPLPIVGVSLPTVIAWSPDGTRLALVNLPGRAAAEAWVLDVRSRELRRVVELPAPAEFEGVTWSADGRSLLLGRVEYDAEVLLLRLR